MNPRSTPLQSSRVFIGDCFGGIIAALIAIPYGLAMASLMGLPPVLGIFTSIVTAPVTATFGRNPVFDRRHRQRDRSVHRSGRPATRYRRRGQNLHRGAGFMMLFSPLRLGRHIQKVPQAVVTGFSCGSAG